MSVNSFAFPRYMFWPLKELYEKGLVTSSIVVFSNPNRVLVTLAQDVDSRWRTSREGSSVTMER